MQSKKSKIKVVNQIKKLMMLARSEFDLKNFAAAERCREKIAELRARHNVTEEIPLDDEVPADDFDGEPAFAPTSPLFRRRRIFWQEVLFGTLAIHFDCRSIVVKNSNMQFVIGDAQNRRRTIDCFHQLHDSGIVAAKEYSQSSPTKARIENQSFLLGFVLGIQNRLAGFQYNEAQLARWSDRWRHHLPQSQEPVNPQGLVKSERIAVTEKSERRERIETETADLKKAPSPEIKTLDDDAYIAGVEFGHSCGLPDDLIQPAIKIFEELEKIEKIMREKYEKHLNRPRSDYSWAVDLGTPSGSYTTTTTFRGTQINLNFD